MQKLTPVAMKPLKFRLGVAKDVSTLVTINIDGAESYRAINLKMFKELTKTKQVLCAVQDQEIVALLYWRNDFLGRFNQWYLKQITVSKKYRKQGVGLSLLKEFLVYAKNKKVEKVFADVHNDNYASLSTCLNAGGLISGYIEGVGKTKGKDERVIFRFEL